MLKRGLHVLILMAIIGLSLCDEEYQRQPVAAPPRRVPPEFYNNNRDSGSVVNGGFMQTAKDFVASPTGQLAMSMAKEFISRSAGGSEVLSLNLPSLLILVLLKALIFSTGLLGAGNWSQYGRGRSFDGNAIVDNSEMQMFLGFLAAEGSKRDGCLYRAVCMAPEHGAEYMKAAKALLEGLGIFDPLLPENRRYNEYLLNIQQAVLEGMQSAPCDMIYHCNI